MYVTMLQCHVSIEVTGEPSKIRDFYVPHTVFMVCQTGAAVAGCLR